MVEYSRFFNFPRQRSSPAPPPGLRALSRSKLRSGGTWLSASSPADLLLRRTAIACFPVLSVSLLGAILEEHFVAHLCFSLPKDFCDTRSNGKASRVIFASFDNSTDKIQKFALCFPTCEDAKAFLGSVKECTRKTPHLPFSMSDFVSETMHPSEKVVSKDFLCRIDERSSFVEPFASYLPRNTQDLTCQNPPSSIRSRLCYAESVHSDLPSSFIELLNDCSTTPDAGLAAAAGNPSKRTEHMMSDASFHDMLSEMEMFIHELGGNLAVELFGDTDDLAPSIG